MLKLQCDVEFQIVAISDALKGSLYDPKGLDIARTLETVKNTGKLYDYPGGSEVRKGWNSLQTIRESNADTIVEVTFTNIQTGQPAIDHCRAAFEAGKNVVTSNKGPVALKYVELSALARENNVLWGIEGTVMSGTPTLRMAEVTLTGNDIYEIRGILNGTTNYILSLMEQGTSFEEALVTAQKHGYAEADPTSDIEGYDAMYKAVILANVVMGLPLTPDQVSCCGITNINPVDIEKAKVEGKRWKLIAHISKEGDTVNASVSPEMLPLDDPLAGVIGTTNAITYNCDLIGPVTVMGAGAGRKETGFSLLIDLINFVREQKYTHSVSDRRTTIDV